MSSLPPLVSLPEPEQTSPAPPPSRRLVKPLRRSRDLDAERGKRAASLRGRKLRQHKRTLLLALGVPVGASLCWLGWRALSVLRPVWPSGRAISTGQRCVEAPVSVGSNWFFASAEGSVWRAGNGASGARRVWTGAFPCAPQIVAAPGGALGGVLIAGGDGTLVCLDAGGREKWSAQAGATISARPAPLRSGALWAWVGADDTGRVWARDARSGASLWRSNAGAPVGEGVAATPWGVVAPLLGSATSRGGLKCFDAKSGKVKWTFPANPRDRAAGTATPRFEAATNRLFWCNDEGAVVALDARTGRKIWKTFASPRSKVKGAILLRASPILAGGVLVVGGSDGGLRAFEARTGHALWTRFGTEPLSSPLGKARFDERLVVVAGRNPVRLVDAQSGDLVRELGAGQVAWNGREFAAADDAGVWRFWKR